MFLKAYSMFQVSDNINIFNFIVFQYPYSFTQIRITPNLNIGMKQKKMYAAFFYPSHINFASLKIL